MLGVLVCQDVTPGDQSQRLLEDSCMNGVAIAGVPDNEGVVLSKGSQETIIWGECQLLYAHLHSFQHSHWSLGAVVPQNDRGIWKFLKDCA